MPREKRSLTWDDRRMIEKMHNKGAKNNEIAFYLEVHESTISRELKRGRTYIRDYMWAEIEVYSAQKAQAHADYQNTAKGRPLKIGNNWDLVRHLENEILSGKSPDIIINQLKREGRKPFSTNTFYRYIDSGLIFSRISNKHLLEKPTRKPRGKKEPKSTRSPSGRSIELRPRDILSRSAPGHWEMDCVIGKSYGKKEAVLVLTERKTRFEIIRKLPDKTTASVVRALRSIRREYSMLVFSTVTVDNGMEFSDCANMQKVLNATFYYCHPFCSSERGSNERMNRMIRRFFPKGQSLKNVTNADCKRVQDWLNSYPRKILHYQTPVELLQKDFPDLPIPPSPTFSTTKILQHY